MNECRCIQRLSRRRLRSRSRRAPSIRRTCQALTGPSEFATSRRSDGERPITRRAERPAVGRSSSSAHDSTGEPLAEAFRCIWTSLVGDVVVGLRASLADRRRSPAATAAPPPCFTAPTHAAADAGVRGTRPTRDDSRVRRSGRMRRRTNTVQRRASILLHADAPRHSVDGFAVNFTMSPNPGHRQASDHVQRRRQRVSRTRDHVSYQWSFSDGTTERWARASSHDFGSPGTYVVTLTITDDIGQVRIEERRCSQSTDIERPLDRMAENSRIDDLRRRVQKDPASIAFAQLAEECRRAGRISGSGRHLPRRPRAFIPDTCPRA